MKFESDRGFTGMGDTREPPISAMTQTALDILQKNDKGFFLMIEGMSHKFQLQPNYNYSKQADFQSFSRFH